MINTVILTLTYFLNNRVNRLVFAFFASAFLSTCLPFIGFGFAAWIGLVPLFLLIRTSRSVTHLALESFAFAFLYNLISFSWLVTLHPLDWQGLNSLESFSVSLAAWLTPTIFHSLLVVIFAVITNLIFRMNPDNEGIIHTTLISGLWVIIQHKIASIFIFAVPINLLAYSQFKNLWLIQGADTLGAIGIEFLIVFVNLFIADILNPHEIHYHPFNKIDWKDIKHINPRFEIQSNTVVVFVVIIISFATLFTYGFIKQDSVQSKQISFGVAQANLHAKDIRGSNLNLNKLVSIHKNLSKDLNGKDLLIWPEGAVASTNRNHVSNLIEHRSNKPQIKIFGTYYSKNDKIFNSIEVRDFNKEQVSSEFYHKKELVPFGEYTPFFGILPKPLKELAKSTVGEGFSPGPKKQNTIKTRLGRLGLSICFELLFPELIRNQVMHGANFLINLNDLSWFKSNFVHKEFLAAAVFRAIENQRDLVLAGNSGYSALIRANGSIESISSLHEATNLKGSINSRESLSVYTKYGW